MHRISSHIPLVPVMSNSRRRIHPHRSWNELVSRFVDAAAIVAGLAADKSVLAEGWSDRAAALSAIAVVVYFLVAEVTGLYRSWQGSATDREVVCALGTWTGAILVGMAFAYMF